MAMRQLRHQVSSRGQNSSCRHHAAAPYRRRTVSQGQPARSVQGNPGPQAQATTIARQPVGSSRQQQRARTAADLNDPAHIGASGQSSTTLKEYGEGATSLTTYMLLPVEQYFVLDPKQIKFLAGNRFLLAVPRIDILGVWLEAEVEVSVLSQGTPPMIVLRAENCRIRGSDSIENLRLDQRFCLKFVTELTWTSLPPASGSGPGTGQIFATTQVDVWCEVIPPFNLMPREVLEASCNVVMRSLVNSLLPLFVRRLGEDYEKWSRDADYRVMRAQRKMPLS